MNHKPVVVVGAGIAGLSVAYFLNKAGHDVTILDRGSGENNCSYGNAGMIVPSHIIPLASPGMIRKGLKWMFNPESPFYIQPRLSLDLIRWGLLFHRASTREHVDQSAPVLKRLLTESREILIGLEERENLQFGLERRGLFMFCNSQKGLDEEASVVEKALELGMEASVLTPAEVRQMEPDLDLEIIGATYFPGDAHLHPGSLMNRLKSLLLSRGVAIRFETEVAGFQVEAGRVTAVSDSSGKKYPTASVVVSSGVWSSGLAKTAGVRLPMQAGKGYSFTLEEPKLLPDNCGIFAEAKVTMTPMNGTLRFGGTMEITGNDRTIREKKVEGIKKSVCRYLPQFTMSELESRKIWVGHRPCSPDGMPYIGRLHGFDNLYTSTGHAMMGMSLGPAAGKLVADLITTGSSDLTHPLVDPNRYSR
ncbi:MAG: FAD-dependent oxidoreductase [Balneolaceae bacterium]